MRLDFIKKWPLWARVILSITGISLLVFGLWVARATVQISSSLQSTVEKGFVRTAQGTLTLGSTSWNWGYIDFTDVRMNTPYLPGPASIERIRVHLTLRTYIRSGFDPMKAVSLVEISSPTLVFGDSLTSWLLHMRSRPSSSEMNLPPLRIAMSDGTVLFRRTRPKSNDSTESNFTLTDEPQDTLQIAIMRDLSGFAYLDSGTVMLSGSVLSDSLNLFVSGHLTPKPMFDIGARNIDFGRMQGIVAEEVQGIGDIVGSLRDTLDARVVARNISFLTSEGVRVGPFSLSIEADGREVHWAPTRVPVGELSLLTRGHVHWGDTTHVDATLEWEGNVRKLGALVGPSLRDLSGYMRGKLAIEGPLKRPDVTIDLRADTLSAKALLLRNVRIRCHADSRTDSLIVDDMQFRLDGARVVGTGGGTLNPPDIHLALESTPVNLASLRGTAGLGITGYAQLDSRLHAGIDGATGYVRVTLGETTYRNTPVPLRTLRVTRDSTGALLAEAFGPSISLNGWITMGRDTIFTGGLGLDGYRVPHMPDSSAVTMDGRMRVVALRDNLSAMGQLFIARRGKKTIPVNLSVQSGLSQENPLTVRASTKSLPLLRGFAPDAKTTLIRLTNGWYGEFDAWKDRIQVRGRIIDGDSLVASARLDHAPVEKVATFIRASQFFHGGHLTAYAELSGRLGALHGTGTGRVNKLYMKRVDSLDVGFRLGINPDSVSWITGPLKRNGIGDTLVTVSGSYRLKSREVFVRFHSPGPRGRMETALALSGVPLKAEGAADFRVRLYHRRGQRMTIDIDAEAHNGTILVIPFDTVRVTLRGNTLGLNIDGDLTKTGEYRGILRNGTIPAGRKSTKELDLPIRIPPDPDNNVLGLLLRVINQGIEGRGPGSGVIRVAGARAETVIGGGHMEIHGGTLKWPGSIWPEWKNVSGRASVVQGTRFLKIEQVTANVGDGRILATNQPAAEIGARPLLIKPVGLSLGVVQVQTPQDIPLHVKGGMPVDESLSMKLKGRGPLEQFTFSGPWENPVAAGEIELSDGYFTYPLFTGSSTTGTGSALGIIQRMNWQIDIVVGHDLYYDTSPGAQRFWSNILSDPLQMLGSMAAEMEAKLVEGGRVHLQGIYADRGLHAMTEGLYSTQARISVLNIDFVPDEPIVVDWDTRQDLRPRIKGRGVASIGDSVRVFARLVTIDSLTHHVREGGRLGQLSVQLDTDASLGVATQREKELEILRLLGFYSGDPSNPQLQPREFGSAAYRTFLRRSEQSAWRMMFSPLTRTVRRFAHIDVFQVQPSLVLNLLDIEEPETQLAYLQGTSWTLGQYIWGNFLVSYRGELELTRFERPTLGARHQVGVEWAFSPRTRFALTRDIDVPVGIPDTRFSVRHRFTFTSF
jgi:hypothetical protein